MSTRLCWLVALTAGPQAFFMILEMFFWNTGFVRKISGLTSDTANDTKSLGCNMGLYNGLLAAGLAWSFYASPTLGMQPALFFVGFMLIAGIFGALTIKPINFRILLAQALPAAAALAILQWL
jgi:putative membrane protein